MNSGELREECLALREGSSQAIKVGRGGEEDGEWIAEELAARNWAGQVALSCTAWRLKSLRVGVGPPGNDCRPYQ